MNKGAALGLAVAIGAVLASSSARADEPTADGARFRGGAAAKGGALIIPSSGDAGGVVGAEGHLGVQVNHLVGIYAVPQLALIFGAGGGGGAELGAAVLADFTFDHRFQIGAGPEIISAAAFSSSVNVLGTLYGGRLHIAGFPLLGTGENGIRRKGLMVGADVSFLTSDGGGFLLQPTAVVGYEAF